MGLKDICKLIMSGRNPEQPEKRLVDLLPEEIFQELLCLDYKTKQQMAQKWMKKHGSRDYQTEKQIAKQKEIRDIAAGNTNIPPSERTITPTRTHTPSGPTRSPHAGNRGTGAGGMGRPGGGGYGPWKAEGGLISLWPR